MNYDKKISLLWDELNGFFTTAYEAKTGDSHLLRDYQQDGWHNDLKRLLEEETKNERQHRRGAPAGYHSAMSAFTAAKLLLMGNMVEGAGKKEMPPASIFLMFRKTAAEGWVLGYLLRDVMTAEWKQQVSALDYAKIMNAKVSA